MIEIREYTVINGPARGRKVQLVSDGDLEQMIANCGLLEIPMAVLDEHTILLPNYYWVDAPRRQLIYVGHYLYMSCPKN